MVSGAMRSLFWQAMAPRVTRSIHATFSPNALAPQTSNGFEDTTSTSAGATPRFNSISLEVSGAGLKIFLESTLTVAPGNRCNPCCLTDACADNKRHVHAVAT